VSAKKKGGEKKREGKGSGMEKEGSE